MYGESPHGARKAIPLRKRLRNRANRHQQDSTLPVTPTHLEDDEADKIESSIRRKAPKNWNKLRDAPLGGVIAGKQERRAQSQARKLRARALRAFCDGRFCGNCPTCRSDVFILAGRHGGEHYGAFCAVGQALPNPTFCKVAIRPCRPSELPEVARELHSLCVDSGDPWLGDWLCRLFGSSTCPKCGKPLDISRVVAAYRGLRRVYSASGAMSRPGWLLHLSHWLYYQP